VGGVAGYLKEGCVHLTVDMWVEDSLYKESKEKGIKGLASLVTGLQDPVWQEGQLLVSIHNQIAYIKACPAPCTCKPCPD
jgi:hypothetical protein